MTIRIETSCAGSTFYYAKGDIVTDANTPVARLKDLVRAGHAVDITADRGEKVERKVKTEIETR